MEPYDEQFSYKLDENGIPYITYENGEPLTSNEIYDLIKELNGEE